MLGTIWVAREKGRVVCGFRRPLLRQCKRPIDLVRKVCMATPARARVIKREKGETVKLFTREKSDLKKKKKKG